MRELKIADKIINDESDCFVIAEIGHNHQGNIETAKEMIAAASLAGANAVKFQKRDNRMLFTKEMYDSPYTNRNSYGSTYGKHRDALEFNMEQYSEMQAFAKEQGVLFFATPFDFNSVDFLEKLDVPLYKISSGDLKSIPLIKYVAQIGKPIIASTGGSTMDDIKRLHDEIIPINSQLAILQCTAAYPCEPEEMNLNVITTMQNCFPKNIIGLSDHQNGIAMALVAFTLGARIIEKHFTLNRAWPGTDHAFSLEPQGLSKLVRDLKRTRVALGSYEKFGLEKEKKPLFKMGKKLVAAKDLKKGKVITESDVALKSPGDGMPPYEYDNIIGRTLKVDLSTDGNFSFDILDQ